jgi:membrane protein
MAPVVAVVKDAWRAFSSQGGRLLAGAIAYSALLSLVPLFLLVVRLAALVTDASTARATLLANLTRWVGPSGAETIGELLERAEHSGTHATVIGAVVLVWGATRLFGAVRRSLDVLWGTAPSVEDTVRDKAERFLQNRLLGFLFVISIAGALVVLAFLHGALAMVDEVWDLPTVGRVGEVLLSFAMTAALFAAIYRVLPSKTVPLRDAATGGVITAALFTAGAIATGAYVAHQAARSPFGTATSLVLMLVWVHYSAHAFLFGAAITAARAKRKGLL